MGGTLGEKEAIQFNLYRKHDNEGVNDKVGDPTDHFEGDVFFNDGDNCVVSYEKDQDDKTSNATKPSEGCQEDETRSCKQRLLVVANRLPVTATRMGGNEWKLEISVGGLVSALLGLTGFEAKWIGWPGVDVPDKAGQESLTKALAEKRCIPVFLDKETINQYYNGYCNNILWPMLHYFSLPQEDRLSTSPSSQSQFEWYKLANQMFADAVCKHYKDGDIVWCHDYHLMYLPQFLKEFDSKMTVGWFLHTPFPSSEIHRTLPSRSELLRSVLAADIVGFHTYDYARHFVSACTRILGLEGTPEGVEDHGKLTRVSTFPIGIDANRFIRALELPQTKAHVKNLWTTCSQKKIILGVDRLDMIKGIPQKILAFEKFLEENPDWRTKVTLMQIAVPTRTDVPEYQKLARQVHEMVGRINGRFGTLSSVPIHYLDRSLDFHALCALYSQTDVALVTSLRDGMNLVSYEFVVCQAEKKGVLILSELASSTTQLGKYKGIGAISTRGQLPDGAAQSLGAGAILVNPWNISEVASSIAYALNMPRQEREKRHRLNYMHVTTHTAQEWAKMFVSELDGTVVEAQLRAAQEWAPPSLPVNVAIEKYVQSHNRLLILGFNSTLTPSDESPSIRDNQNIDLGLNLHPDVHELLRRISCDPQTTIIVLSGSDRSVLDENFGSYNMWLAAENGIFLRHTKGDWMTTMPECSGMEWVDSIKHVFEYFTKRTPHSSFVHRETSLLWNYKYSDTKFGKLQAKDMLLHLWTGPVCSSSVDVFQGAHSVEVRAVGLTKGAAIDRILAEIAHSKVMDAPIDYVLCIGHFLGKDEDIYLFFEPEPPVKPVFRTKTLDTERAASSQRNSSGLKSLSKSEITGTHRRVATCSSAVESMETYGDRVVLDLKAENYFSCSVERKHTRARYVLGSSEDVVVLLRGLAEVSSPSCQ